MDAAQWQQQVGFSMSMEEIIANNNTGRAPPPQQQQQQQQVLLDNNSNNNSQRRSRPEKEQNINCPRCNSTNIKFCYYNNYSLTQPRYFCKTCRRYWTQGGSLRNVPVGGGSRKNKRSTPSSSSPISPSSSPAISSLSSSIASPISSPNTVTDLNPPTTTLSHLIPPHKTHHHYQDLNLAFPTSTATQDLHAALLQPMEMPKIELGSCFRSSYVPVPMPDPNGSSVLYPSSGFPNPQEVKSGLMGFPGPADGLGLVPRFNIGSLQENNNTSNSGDGASARLLFPFGDINKFPSHHNATTTSATGEDDDDDHQSMKGSSQDHHHQGASGYWSGMLGGGTW